MMNEETKASLNKFLKEREERIKNMTLAEARDTVSRIYGHSDMRMESDKALQMLLDCADKALEQRWIPVSERLPEEERKEWIDRHFDVFGYLYPCLVTRYSSIIPKYVAKHYFDGKHFVNNDGEKVHIKYIIAWMPLPEPYKAESEDVE